MFSHALIWNWACVEGWSCWHQHEGAPLWRLTVSWADLCTWLTLLSGPALCSASPTPGLSPPVHKLPAQVTAFASPSSSCVTRPLASSSLLLQHSVDCLTHRKWQVNISCTELICTWLHLLLLLCPWDGAMGDSLSLRQQPPRPPASESEHLLCEDHLQKYSTVYRVRRTLFS